MINRTFALICSLGVLFASLLGGTPGRADEALDLYNRAIALYSKHRFIEAAEAFREVYRLKPSWKLYYNLGQAEAAARRYGLALDAFETYLVEGGDEIKVQRRQEILKEIEEFKLLVGTIEVDAPDGTQLLVDGKPRGTTPLSGIVRVAAGLHQLTLKKDGEELLDQRYRIAGETTTRLSPNKDPEVTAAAPTGPPTASTEENAETTPPSLAADKKGRGKLIAGVALGSMGLAGIGVGIAFTFKSISQYDTLESPDISAEEFDEKKPDYDRSQAIYIAGYAAGGVLLATGIALIAVDVWSYRKSSASGEVSFSPTLGGVRVSF